MESSPKVLVAEGEVVVQPHEVAPALERPLRPHVDRAGEAVLDEAELGGLERVPRHGKEEDAEGEDADAAAAPAGAAARAPGAARAAVVAVHIAVHDGQRRGAREEDSRDAW